MAFYIVLHHPDDRSVTRWSNEWETGSSDRIRTITTTTKIAREAEKAVKVYVHRCGFTGIPPAVVCEAKVLGVVPIDRASCLVRFETVRTMQVTPTVSPGAGQNSYLADKP